MFFTTFESDSYQLNVLRFRPKQYKSPQAFNVQHIIAYFRLILLALLAFLILY